jgi:hypothetical protein
MNAAVGRRTILLSLGSLCAIGPAIGGANAVANSTVQCRAWTQSDINLNGDIELTAVIFSGSESLVYNLIAFGSLGFLFAIMDAHTQKWLTIPDAPQPHPFVPGHLLQAADFIKLSPGMVLGARIVQRAQNLFPVPGRYRFSVTYRSPISKSEIAESDAWLRDKALLREQGTIFAPEFDVTVV